MAEKEAYAEKESFLDITVHEYKEKYQLIEIVILSIASFTIPIFFGHPQLLVGAIINALLFRSALTAKFTKTLPIIFLPSIGAFVGGVLFGGFTPFLVYFMPMIWAGNALYVLTAKFVQKYLQKNYGFNILAASLVKSGLLFGSAFLMVQFFGFPAMFLAAMGTMQLYTALIGGTAAELYTRAELALKKSR